jgi:uncharacterized protein (UPF0332 family)
MTLKTDYIEYKLKRADDAIKAAELLMKEGFWLDCLSKIYYAAFYAVTALLINMELNPKTHNGTKSLFHKEFILKGVIDKKFGFLYDTLLAKRFEADYENFALIDEKEVPEYLKSVKEFILKAKEIVRPK